MACILRSHRGVESGMVLATLSQSLYPHLSLSLSLFPLFISLSFLSFSLLFFACLFNSYLSVSAPFCVFLSHFCFSVHIVENRDSTIVSLTPGSVTSQVQQSLEFGRPIYKCRRRRIWLAQPCLGDWTRPCGLLPTHPGLGSGL